MKKILIIIGICLLFISTPAMNAFQLSEKPVTINKHKNDILIPPPLNGYDGTFVGVLGRLYKEGEEWKFDEYAYLAGNYKLGTYKRIRGYIYDLDEQQIGYIYAFFGRSFIIGYIQDMANHFVPIIGFLLWNDQHFAGRIMSMFGPATHIIGEFIPNT
jgi:hypothetical protein